MKEFYQWTQRKKKLHESKHKIPYVSERDLWWVSLGENVGSEINGKSAHFTRPAIILRKLAHGFYLIAPTTTQFHIGSWYVHITFDSVEEYVCLHQIRVVDYRRVYTKLGQISVKDFEKVRSAFSALYRI